MLTELLVENFKGFGTLQRAPLAPITLIYGGNSAGKSSLIQALLLMAQSSGDADRGPQRYERQAELVVRGELVDLGSFDAMVHRHDRSASVTVGWSTDVRPVGVNRLAARVRPGLNVSARLQFGRPSQSGAINHQLSAIGDLDFRPVDPGLQRRLENEVERFGLRSSGWLVASPEATLAAFRIATDSVDFRRASEDMADGEVAVWGRQLEQMRAQLVVDTISGIPSSVLAFETTAGLAPMGVLRRGQSTLFSSSNELEQAGMLLDAWLFAIGRSARLAVSSIDYLGPMRKAPERLHVLSGERVRGAGTRGEHVVDLLARQPQLRQEVNYWFSELGIPYTVDVRPVTDKALAGAIGEVHCVLLQDSRGVEVSPTDVGFGIGQVLPVVAQTCLTGRSTLCIEQPEIHLHPALQARLAELFARAIHTQRDAQFILETHSEHLLLRTQRLIRRGVLKPSEVSVLFVDALANGESRVIPLRLEADGTFRDEWPGGFFDERYDELFGE